MRQTIFIGYDLARRVDGQKVDRAFLREVQLRVVEGETAALKLLAEHLVEAWRDGVGA